MFSIIVRFVAMSAQNILHNFLPSVTNVL